MSSLFCPLYFSERQNNDRVCVKVTFFGKYSERWGDARETDHAATQSQYEMFGLRSSLKEEWVGETGIGRSRAQTILCVLCCVYHIHFLHCFDLCVDF